VKEGRSACQNQRAFADGKHPRPQTTTPAIERKVKVEEKDVQEHVWRQREKWKKKTESPLDPGRPRKKKEMMLSNRN
jgi:hypothetical protein